MISHIRIRIVLVLTLLNISGLWLNAQTLTSATIVGIVTDSTGAAIPGATVRITQAETDAARTAKTGSGGEYRFPFLKPGEYTVTAENTGLAATSVHLQLLVGQEQSVNLALGVQSVQQSVTVDTSATLLQAENGNQVASYSQQFIENTPVNGGDITNVAFTTPGLRLNVGGGNANFNVNGLPFNSVLFTMNGADIVEPYNLNNKSGASNNTLGANDVAEAAVIINAYSAQYGREAGAQVNYISKSGTNRLHGNLVENYNGSFLNANDYFNKLNNTPRARSVANQYAASIGGPILKDKLAFFVNTEGLRYALPSSGVVSLPSPALQQYILAHVPASSLPIYQSLFSLYNAAPGIGRAVPVINGSLPLQDSSGHLGCGRQTFTGTFVNGSSGQQFGVDTPCAVAFGTTASSINTEYFVSGRLDYNINDKQKLYFRMSRDAGTQASFTSPISPIYNRQSVQPWVIPQVNYTYAITPNLVNNLILNGNWYSAITGPADFAAARAGVALAFGFLDGGANGSNTTNGGPTSSTSASSSSGFAGVGPSLPVGRRGQQLGLIDDVSWSIGHHTLQAGVNDRNNRISDSSIASGSVVGTYNFSDVSDFAKGIVNSTGKGSSYTQSYPLLQTVHTRLNSLGFYVQDEWKILRNLNLTYGVRFELQGNPSCKENCYSRANTAFLASGYQAGLSVPYNSTLQTGLNKNFKGFEGIVTEPRFALAYSPRGEGKTVIRGGIGLFANTIQGSITSSVFGNAPNKFSPTVSTGTVGLAATTGSSQAAATASNQAFQTGFSQGYTLTQLRAAVPAGTTFATPTLYVNPDQFRTIKVLEWSAELEQPLDLHDLLSISYSGNHGYNEPLTNAAANAYVSNLTLYPNGFAGLPTSTPDPRFSTVTQISNAGVSNYNGLTVTERHAFVHNFQGQVSYTWSHSLQFGTVYNPVLFAQTSQRTGSYGPTNFDTRHNLEADLLYTQPKLHGRLLNSTLGGWTVGGKLYRYSGRPFTVTDSLIQSGLVAAGQTNTFPSSTLVLADTLDQRAIGSHCGKASVKSACLSTSQFASAVTASNPNGQRDFGNTSPNSFRGPGFFSIAAQLSKTVPVTEHTRFDFGADAYNLLNHTNLAVPNSNVGGSGFGLITSTVSSPTSIYGTGQGAIVSGRVLVVFGKFIF
jgi:Carboxypeptidase regulatory-like domain/TonB-dependent Receptor Plug Domain